VDILEDGSKVFEIRGNFASTVQALPLTDDYLADTFKLDSDYCDIDEEIGKIRVKVKSKDLSRKKEQISRNGFTIYPGTGVRPQRNVICFSPIFLDWNGHLIMRECLLKADQAFRR
jgi:hypothetical protein